MGITTRVRQPEYTGDNRCTPCTVVNLVGVTILAALAMPIETVLGGLIFAIGGSTIWLRGYVIPYTPQFAPRLVAAVPPVARYFDHSATDRSAGGLGDADADGERLLEELIDAGVFLGNTDLQLDPNFRADWRAAMDDLQGEDLAVAIETASPRGSNARRHENGDDAWFIVTDDERSIESERWLSVPVAYADVAAIRALSARGIDSELAADAAAPLRLFLEKCPACGDEITETTSSGCCGGFGPGGPDRILTCVDCDQWIAILDD